MRPHQCVACSFNVGPWRTESPWIPDLVLSQIIHSRVWKLVAHHVDTSPYGTERQDIHGCYRCLSSPWQQCKDRFVAAMLYINPHTSIICTFDKLVHSTLYMRFTFIFHISVWGIWQLCALCLLLSGNKHKHCSNPKNHLFVFFFWSCLVCWF